MSRVLTLCALGLATDAAAQQAAVPPESQAVEARAMVQPTADPEGGLEFFALFQTRANANDLASTNPLLDGQVVGNLGGTNGIVVDPTQTALYTEQRVGGFFTYRPPILDGRASLSAAFEVDLAFGDQAYGTGGNTGGGFGGDQVNLQTRRLHADVYPSAGIHSAHIIAGLQFVGDSVADPTASTPDGLIRSGGRLMFWGSEAAGLAVYGKLADGWGTRLRYRVGAFTLLEQGVSLPDDVLLAVGDLELQPAYATRVGAHLWYVQDRSGGTGGALGVGPTSALSELQGGPRLDPYEGFVVPDEAEIHADLVWTGLDGGYNAGLDHGPAGVHGLAMLQLGRVYAPIAQDTTVFGGVLGAEGRVRYARGEGSVLRAEGLLTTADDDDPARYGGVITGNAYGVAGALYPSHGTLLLFPDPRSINRMVAVVSDISAGGRGLQALTASAGFDVVPGRVNVNVGGGHALAGDGSGAFGTEVNGHLTAEPLLFLEVGAHAAVVSPGAASNLDAAPWAVLGTIQWLVI